MVNRSRHCNARRAVIALGLFLVAVPAAYASPGSRQRTQEAYRLAYDLRFEAAAEALAEACTADPRDPAPPRAIAALAWMEILFSQGVATFEAFTGQPTKGDVARPAVPPALTERFTAHMERAMRLAEQQLLREANADGYYQVGATAAVAALYLGTVEGRSWAAFVTGRRAVHAMERARSLSARPETALIPGMYRYIVSTLPWAVRVLAAFGGLSGDRSEGLAMLEEAAAPGTDTEYDALLILMIVHNRGGQHLEAAHDLSRLRSAFPHNRLLALNAATTAVRSMQFADADRLLSEGMRAPELAAPPDVLGEHALWLLTRGTARAALGTCDVARAHLATCDAARADLMNALAVGPRDWVRARAHLQLGKLALGRSDLTAARAHWQQAIAFGERGADGDAVQEARALVRRVPRT